MVYGSAHQRRRWRRGGVGHQYSQPRLALRPHRLAAVGHGGRVSEHRLSQRAGSDVLAVLVHVHRDRPHCAGFVDVLEDEETTNLAISEHPACRVCGMGDDTRSYTACGMLNGEKNDRL